MPWPSTRPSEPVPARHLWPNFARLGQPCWTGLSTRAALGRRLGLNAGLRQTNTRKTVQQPSQPTCRPPETPLLSNVAPGPGTGRPAGFYAGLDRAGESGIAPGNASNHRQAMPAIRTSQRDAGLRWQLPGGMKLVAGLFEVRGLLQPGRQQPLHRAGRGEAWARKSR